MWTITFWKAVAERAISTAAQAALGVLISVASVGAIDWRLVGSTVLIATLVSVLKNIAAAAITDGSPSLNGSESLQYEQPPTYSSGVTDSFTKAGNDVIVHDPGNGDAPTTTTLS